CAQFDTGSQPLLESEGPTYLFFLDAFLTGASPNPPNNSLNGVEDFVRGGTEDEALTALEILGTGLFDVDPVLAADPDYAAGVRFATQRIWTRMSLADPSVRGRFVNDPFTDPVVSPAIAGLLGSQLENSDGLRSFSSRRTTVDALKAMQFSGAL